jgi:hypothetical protein
VGNLNGRGQEIKSQAKGKKTAQQEELVTAWTHRWTREQVSSEEQNLPASGLLDHTAGNTFCQRGVVAGDAVYIITFYEDDLRVIGRLTVDDVVDRRTAVRRLREKRLYRASDHVLASAGTATGYHFDAIVPRSKIGNIEFIKVDGKKSGVKYNRTGRVEQQTFRGVREITAATAKIFDGVLGPKP